MHAKSASSHNGDNEMLLIPGGYFLIGSSSLDKDAYRSETPHEKIFLDSFHISRYPVTNAEYKAFIDATGHRVPFVKAGGKHNWHVWRRTYPAGRGKHPVVLVDWNDAIAYAAWVGVRLPTEAEWEKAASWDHSKNFKRRYSWGDQFDASLCNTMESRIADTTSVGNYSPGGDSPYGLADVVGNIWEWTASEWSLTVDLAATTHVDLKGSDKERRVIRGGSWDSDRVAARCAFRAMSSLTERKIDLGFRVAKSTML